ncbi:MAG TPA: chemotaxis-specific protein-glutamate methyltransferase CheB [Polyangiaceae bacterium]|jgi:two-component system chemotaxis response regulator CheB
MALRVLVVDDSLTVRKRIVETLARDSELEVVGECGDGKSAIELCQTLRPDVITLDMMLPIMTGLAATEWIMAHRPTPILIVSASTNRGELFRTYEALAAGAVDVLDKPLGDEADDAWEAKLVRAVKLVSRIKVITHVRGKLAQPDRAPARTLRAPAPACRVVAIGASTGGPSALSALLSDLGGDFPVPILLVMHISTTFGAAFADWLDGLSPLRVTFAQDGMPLPQFGSGRVVMAPSDRHLFVRGDRLFLSDAPERHSCKPSVDVLFESVATELGASATACLLTGMGKDGAAGLLAIQKAGGYTIAQDEASSVVYGMPREAALLGAAREILPLRGIAGALRLRAGKAP